MEKEWTGYARSLDPTEAMLIALRRVAPGEFKSVIDITEAMDALIDPVIPRGHIIELIERAFRSDRTALFGRRPEYDSNGFLAGVRHVV